MNKKDFDRKNHKNKNHSGGCHFFYDSNSIHKEENNTLNSFNAEDFDKIEEKEFRRRCKRLRYNERHSYRVDW